jgi:predicted Rossmann fold flavoprotein
LRVFPQDARANSVVRVLEKELLRLKVNILHKTEMKNIMVKEGKVCGVLLSDGKILPAEHIILACGGISYPFTGSCGDGFRIAKKLGHTIVDLRPGLVALETKENYPRYLEGLTLKNIRLTFKAGKKQVVSEIGEFLFTSSGVSGPLVLSLSGKIIDWLREGWQVSLEIDLKPGLTENQLETRLLREFKANAKKTVKNTLKSLLPQRLINIFLEIAHIPVAKLVSQISKEERMVVLSLLKALPLTIKGSRPIEEAMVTRGGVSLKEIDPRTMESRLVKGLYFAGEIIDIDADTGGFNLQAAFSTGYLAGESAAS